MSKQKPNPSPCVFTPGVECEWPAACGGMARSCRTCGWNPKVWSSRVKEIRAAGTLPGVWWKGGGKP